MRVTHVITRLIVGGAQENTIASVLGLRQKPGLTVDLISGPSPGPEGSLESSLPISRANRPPESGTPSFSILPSLVRPVHPWNDCVALRALTGIFQQTRPDIVHTHSGKAGILGRLAAARAGVPIIIHTIHGPSFGPFQGALANLVFRSAERRAGRITTHFVTVAAAMTEQYLAAGIGRREQYTRVFSGFDLDPYRTVADESQHAATRADWRARWGLTATDFVVGKIARLFKLKGHDDLFAVAPELVRRCPQMKFLLVGDGPWRGRFEAQARSLGLERHFVFTGLVPPGEVPRLVGVMDVLVHLSLREGLPRALPQALSAARPVVAYDCDGAKEVCFENETGFLLRPRDLAGLQARLLQLASDAVLCERLGRRGQEFVSTRFGVQKMVDDLYELYLRLSREHPVPVP